MTITFQTDGSVAHEGFMATYISLNSSHLCGGQLMTQTGEITSPNFPDNYPHLRECIWTIVIPEGHQIMLNVTDFQMEEHSLCKYDFLEIRNGGYPSSPLMGQFCGTSIPQTFVSQSNRMFLKFKTDSSDSGKGFKIFYDGRASGCGADLTSSSGSFISPNFPLPYGHQAECFWTITVSEGSTVMLLFAEFDLEHGTECRYDYLEIRDRDRNGQVLAKLCSSVIPQPVNSKTNRIWVKFKTDYSSHGRGFHAVYHSNCEVTLTSVSGVIESPNFPEVYPGKRSCAWKLQSTIGNTLNVSFSHFDLEETSQCTSDYLQVFDGTDTRANSLGKFCGNQLPPNMASTNRYFLIKFISDYSLAGTGFRLEWLTDGCGANLRGRTGTFQTPNYPNPYPVYKECIWTIEVDPGQRVELTFEDLDIATTADCQSGSVEVFGGPDQLAPSLTKLCHTTTKAQKVTSTGNNIFVRFFVQSGNNGRGFKASYKGIVGGCGGNFTTISGTLLSPNYPGDYPHNTDCSWMITVKENANIEMVVEDFAMEVTSSGSEQCKYDFVAFYDGPDQNSRLVQKLCGTNISENSSVITHGNQLYIRMRSDSSVTDKGFKAVYTTGCGGMRDASTDGAITSPNYPEAYTQNKNCTWVIQSPRSGDRVTLTFTYMDIKQSEDCTSDHVEVHEGDDEYSPLIGSYCGQRVPPSFTSRGSALTVAFFSVDKVSHVTHGHGFRAVYTSAAGACGGDLTSQHGAFVSPEYGVSYPLNRECIWTIGGPPGSRVQISARDFNIPSTADCDDDFLDVRDGGDSSRKRWRFCGTDIPANMSFTSNKLWVRFRSSGSVPSGQTHTGFYFYYSLVYGGEVTGESGKIASPNYPKLYPNKLDVEWTITVAVGKRIRIVLENIDLESNTRCFFDYLTFRDGGTSEAPTINSFCGAEVQPPFLSTGNQLNIKFHSDWNREGHGFLFRWEATDEGTVRTTGSPGNPSSMNVTCGETLLASARVQNLSSPGYPSNYANSINCVWKIEADEGSKVWVNVTQVGIEGRTPSCFYDKLEFYDGDGLESPKLTSLCGRKISGDAVISTSTVMTVRFYTDVGLNDIGFMADVRTTCGGLMTSPVGVIKSLDFPSPYGKNQNCTWTIQVTNGRKLALSFSNFNIRSTTGCSEDYLQLTDGAFTDSPYLGNATNGRYCGSTTPSLPEKSRSNSLILNFITSPTSPGGPGFSLTYREVLITCGGRLTLTNDVQSGTFMSHGYPMAYPANIDCIWIITAPSSDGVQVDFDQDFDIEKHRDCKFDGIEIRDGGTENAPVLGRYCGSESPGTIKSSGNVLYIRFTTDDSIPRKGFKAVYKIATCGGTIRGKDGFISSPNFPHTYPSNMECEWHISGLTGHYLTLTFTNFEIDSSDNCTKDFVEVREYNATGRLFGKYCGMTVPTLGDTSDSYAYIKFKSDNTVGKNGFKLKFESGISECGGELVTPSGVIATPNYPGLYPHMRVCTWNIKVQQGRRVTLTFDDFKLEEGGNCYFDHVRVNNGIIAEAPTIAKLCGSETPDVIESSANAMAVIFKTDGSVSNGGFRATYKSDNPARCGGEVSGQYGSIITSPNYDLGYYNHSELCIWTITNQNQANSSISLQFMDFEMESHWACAFDYLKIVETTNQEDRLVDRLCGNRTQLPLVSPSPKLTLIFRTDSSLSMVGFKLAWRIQRCGGLRTTDLGSITSPNYPRAYDDNDFCAWEILAPEGYQIKISFQDMEIEGHSKCAADFLKILNGGSATSPSIGKFCGSDTPKDFTSQSNQLRLEFHTDYSRTAKGFKLQYSFVSGGCGGVLHSLNGSLVKPSGSGLTPQTECIWDITVPYGFHVKLQFTTMKFDCSKKEEFVMVQDIGKRGRTISDKTFCVRDGDVLPDEYASKTNKLRVRYRTPNIQSRNTFALNWSVGCGYLLTEAQGIVMSPMHPRSYPGGLDCNYTISVDPQKFILLEFDDDQFGIERAQIATNNSETMIDNIACKFDYVAIYDGFNETDAKLIGKFCGNKAPQPMSTRANMIVRFKSDATVGDVGFLANYRASKCGGVYSAGYGQIQTPQHPVQYHKSANCSWLITVQENRAVELKFNVFDIELHSACSFDYVEVFDGNTTAAPSLGRFCGKVAPASLRTTGNEMLVIFKSDHSVQLGGFTAAFKTTFGTKQGCGGTLNGATGRISSIDIDYDGRYETDQDCIWQIMADTGKVIKLSFSVFDTEGPMADICRYDFVEIRDGYTFESPLAGRFCGDQVPQPFTASSNRLYLRFKSDSSDNRRGFNASWVQEDARCGGFFNLTKAGPFKISSPNYPQPYPHGLRCRWIVEAPIGKHIMVNMTDFNIKCGYSQTLEVRDMPLGINGKNIYFCRPETPRVFYSLNNSIEIDLSTDQTSSGKGFNLTYEITTCNRTYFGNNGHIYSPGWPGNYDRNANCTMFIQAPPGHKISVFFNTFAVEMHSKCKYDYLAFENPAINDNTTLLRQYCGFLLPDPLFTDLNHLRLQFRSDPSLSGSGFDINYITSPTAGCGGNLTSSNGSFTSPGYPGNDTDASDCVWLLHAPVNTRDSGHLELTFLDFNMGGSQGTCGNNYIEVRTGLSVAAPIFGKYCGVEKPSKLILEDDGYIRYKSDGKTQGTGFRLAFNYVKGRSSP
ncbi:cubilin-like [Lineus longissimus]|uniref:cubilin-like n=1 Tax=Lineus longissimus TaxID=88925 RepID=UPI00315CC1BF